MSKPIAALGLIMMLLFVYQSLRFKASESKSQENLLPAFAETKGDARPSSNSLRNESSQPRFETIPKQAPSREKEASAGEDDAIAPSLPPDSEKPAAVTENQSPSTLEARTGDKNMKFDIKAFAVDEIFVLPQADRERFLERNQLREPGKAELHRYLSDPQAIDSILKGHYQGQFESIDGKSWSISFKIDGQIEEDQFKGELSVELSNSLGVVVSRSETQGPLDEHIRIVEQGDKHSLRISPNEESPNASVYQFFLGSDKHSMLAGNYFQKKDDQTYELLGPFVLKRTGSDSNN